MICIHIDADGVRNYNAYYSVRFCLSIPEEMKSFAIGHFALGYMSGRISAKLLKKDLNIPLVLTLSVIPDMDIIIPFLRHRGPTHSIIVAFMAFVPFFFIFRKRAVPYFLALVQHSLLGDYFVGGGIQLLWPITATSYGGGISILSQTNVILEWMLFLTSLAMMLHTKDITGFFEYHQSNILLSIPITTALLPTILSYPLQVPVWLLPPHLFYLTIMSTSIVFYVYRKLKTSRRKDFWHTMQLICKRKFL